MNSPIWEEPTTPLKAIASKPAIVEHKTVLCVERRGRKVGGLEADKLR